MNPRRRRRLRNQRKQRQRLHHKIWEAVHAAERSRIAQARKVIPAEEINRMAAGLRRSTLNEASIRRVQEKIKNSRQQEIESFVRRLVTPTGWKP